MKFVQLIFLLPCLGWGCNNPAATDETFVPIREQDGQYLFQLENQQLAVDPAIGGRITSLTIAGNNFLTGPEVNDFNWGSTFWPSPQSVWHWPPSAELDNKPYAVMATATNRLKMVSQPDPQTGLVLTKEIAASDDPASYILRYMLVNQSPISQGVAPWEVTRVHTDGVTFFPKGDGDMRGGLLPLTTVSDGIAWFTYVAAKLPTQGDRQLYTDGAEGWMAHINGRVILIKTFPDVPLEKNAPKEGEIELFVSDVKPGKSYQEIEHQGNYTQLSPGDSLIWEVTWYLRELPEDLDVTSGNNLLVDYVRSVIK